MKSFKEYLNENYTHTPIIDGPALAPETPSQLFDQIATLKGVARYMAIDFGDQSPTGFILTQVEAALARANGLLSSVDDNDMKRDPKIKP